jgi:hypothetical protein
VKFLRQLAAVMLAVTIIVGLGLLWARASGGGAPRRAPSREVLMRVGQIKAGVIRIQSGDGFQLGDTRNLIRTCVIEAALAGLVITVSATRRRYRRTRRAAARS